MVLRNSKNLFNSFYYYLKILEPFWVFHDCHILFITIFFKIFNVLALNCPKESLEKRKIIGLDHCDIVSCGKENEIQNTCPLVKELDLSSNLIESWAQVCNIFYIFVSLSEHFPFSAHIVLCMNLYSLLVYFFLTCCKFVFFIKMV